MNSVHSEGISREVKRPISPSLVPQILSASSDELRKVPHYDHVSKFVAHFLLSSLYFFALWYSASLYFHLVHSLQSFSRNSASLLDLTMLMHLHWRWWNSRIPYKLRNFPYLKYDAKWRKKTWNSILCRDSDIRWHQIPCTHGKITALAVCSNWQQGKCYYYYCDASQPSYSCSTLCPLWIGMPWYPLKMYFRCLDGEYECIARLSHIAKL